MNDEPLRIFIGYDSREPTCYHVLAHSIMMRTSTPVSITPLVLPKLREWGAYTRPKDELASTEFSLTRFLVPYLSGYRGRSLFMDSDMLCLADIADLFDAADPAKAVSVCKHDYVPKDATKFQGNVQHAYPRKNWSSLMLFNNAMCAQASGGIPLSPAYVNAARPSDLHRFAWLPDHLVGELPKEWNWLVGEYPYNTKAKVLHYTLGGPWFPNTPAEHAAEWKAERDALLGMR